MLNNLGLLFKTYLTVVNDRMQIDKKLEDDEILFKAIEEKETRMKAEQKASANFASAKSQSRTQGKSSKEKKEFSDWPKCKKCGCKHLANKACKYAKEKCDKCHKKGHISCFHDSYIFLNRDSNPETLFSNSDKNTKTKIVICVNQTVANKMSGTSTPFQIIADLGITEHLIANWDLIQDYYEDYSEYQTRSGEVLPSYDKGTLLLPLDHGTFKLLDIWYTPDLGFNLVSTIQLGKKRIEMWLYTLDQPSQILYNRATLGCADPLDRQYVFCLQKFSVPTLITNSAKIYIKKDIKPGQIELWHTHMGHLGYRSLTTLKDLSTRINFANGNPSELYRSCKDGNQTCQLSKTSMS